MKEQLLEIESLCKVYGKADNLTKALNGITFQVMTGEFLGIMGSSGSGKSTLLNCIATVIRPSGGRISMQGTDIHSLSGARLAEYRGKKIGYLFQNFELLDNLTGQENILLPLSLHNIPGKESRERLQSLADYLEITDVLDKFPAQMSGGQQQRIAAARALILRPDIILADEPTGALDSGNAKALMEKLSTAGFSDEFDSLFEMKVGHINPAEDYAAAFSMSSVLKELENLPDSQDKAILLNNLSYEYAPYLIALSGYNRLLAVSGLPEITLSNDEAAVYMDTGFTDFNKLTILNEILSGRPEVRIADKAFHLTGSIHTVNLVVDRSITLSFALIVPDEVFEHMTDGDYTVYLDAVLSQESLKGQSLLEAVSETNDRLTRAGIPYESYLQNIGRQLFYVVSASYITIYLAIIFMIVANTVLGVQFLTQQQKNRRRYKTLIRLGAPYEALCHSAGKQIRWFFGIPIAMAAVSSLFGVKSLFAGLLPSRSQPHIFTLMWISLAMILLLAIVEYIYMTAVKRMSFRYLLTLMVPEREE